MFFYRTVPGKDEKFIPHNMEEMIQYVEKHFEPLTETEMLSIARQDLKELKIDISKDDYDVQNKSAFRKLDDIFIAENGRYITEAWFVEKYIVGQKRLLKKYGCYAMGLDVYNFIGAQKERLKLLYLLYCFERDFGIEFVKFIQNPTLENVDNLVVNDHTKNGKIMSFLKRNVIKEIAPSFVSAVNTIMVKIVGEWEQQLQKLMLKVDGLFVFQTWYSNFVQLMIKYIYIIPF